MGVVHGYPPTAGGCLRASTAHTIRAQARRGLGALTGAAWESAVLAPTLVRHQVGGAAPCAAALREDPPLVRVPRGTNPRPLVRVPRGTKAPGPPLVRAPR